MDIVINEWFPAYCRVEETDKNKNDADLFLKKFLYRNDVLFIKRPSEFLRKIYQNAKAYQSHRDTFTITILTDFIKRVLRDSNKCVLIDEECPLEKEVLEKLNEGNYSSDTYLFEAASQTTDRLIITTDGKLIDQMKGIEQYKLITLSQYLHQY